MSVDPTEPWNTSADVVVAGYGYAGAVAALTAHDAGARVLLLEKAADPGGNSLVSGGGVVLARDAEQAASYLRHTNAGRTPEAVVRAMAEGLVILEGYLRELCAAVGVELQYTSREHGATYPFPGGETLLNVKIREIPGFSGYPWAIGLRAGARLFKVVADNVVRRGIEVWLEAPARRLVTDEQGAVVGLVAQRDGREVRIQARRAVVLATGGFENNDELKRQYFEAQPVYPVCTLTNTGDGVLMAQKVGAALWHMWHFHGGYGFKFPEFPFAFRHAIRGPRKPDQIMPWIVVDKRAQRFMNEYPPAVQDTGARALEYYDADQQDYPRIPCYLVFDDRGRRLGRIGDTIINDPRYHYRWSDDNMAEVERGWILRAERLEELAALLGVDGSALRQTVERWNGDCAGGHDADFGRIPGTMLPIVEPPFYGMVAWPIVSNTQGGPVHNERQQVLDAYDKPIPRLYAAGELGSMFGHLYLEAGNNSECFVSGQLAGRWAAAESLWDG